MPFIKTSLPPNSIIAKPKELEPTLSIRLHIEHDSTGMAFYDYSGELWLKDMKLCRLSMSQPSFLTENHRENKLRVKNHESSSKTSFNVSLEAILTPKILEYIDTERLKDPKGEIHITIRIEGRYFESNFRVKPSKNMHHSQGGDYPAFFLNDNENDTLLYLRGDTSHLPYTISQATWLHDFLPQFGMGKHLIYEIPKPDLDKLEGEMKVRIEEAFNSLAAMEKAKNRGEWNDVIEKARPLLELVRKKEMVKKAFENAGFPEDSIGMFMGMLDNGFQYSAKFIHKVDLDGKTIRPEIPAQKEDALFIYSMAINILNTLLKKVNR